MADRRKLLETLQDVIDSRRREFPAAFWEILSKRCLKSMHLLEPLELSILARAFDVHKPQLAPFLNVYRPMAVQVINSKSPVPGLAISVLTDILPRRLDKDQSRDLLRCLARRAADVMWEIPAEHAVKLLEELSKFGLQDASLCRRVAKKVQVYLSAGPGRGHDDLPGRVASAFAAQDYRDLELFRHLATMATDGLDSGASWAEVSARQVLQSAEKLEIDIDEVSALRMRMAQEYFFDSQEVPEVTSQQQIQLKMSV